MERLQPLFERLHEHIELLEDRCLTLQIDNDTLRQDIKDTIGDIEYIEGVLNKTRQERDTYRRQLGLVGDNDHGDAIPNPLPLTMQDHYFLDSLAWNDYNIDGNLLIDGRQLVDLAARIKQTVAQTNMNLISKMDKELGLE